jgi:hypothetical protein
MKVVEKFTQGVPVGSKKSCVAPCGHANEAEPSPSPSLALPGRVKSKAESIAPSQRNGALLTPGSPLINHSYNPCPVEDVGDQAKNSKQYQHL